MAAADTNEDDGGTEIDLDRPVDSRAVAVWRWATALAFAPVIAAVSIGAIATTVAQAPPAIAFLIAWPLLLGAIAGIVWKYPPARYRHLRYRIDDAGIAIRDGVFWRTSSALPRLRIQHTDVSQGPLQRHYGVATLKLYTAGSRFTRIELPGLEHAVAVALRDQLQQQANDDAV
jgi:membrane protein YdbS with pleckstrin-like domain